MGCHGTIFLPEDLAVLDEDLEALKSFFERQFEHPLPLFLTLGVPGSLSSSRAVRRQKLSQRSVSQFLDHRHVEQRFCVCNLLFRKKQTSPTGALCSCLITSTISFVILDIILMPWPNLVRQIFQPSVIPQQRNVNLTRIAMLLNRHLPLAGLLCHQLKSYYSGTHFFR